MRPGYGFGRHVDAIDYVDRRGSGRRGVGKERLNTWDLRELWPVVGDIDQVQRWRVGGPDVRRDTLLGANSKLNDDNRQAVCDANMSSTQQLPSRFPGVGQINVGDELIPCQGRNRS